VARHCRETGKQLRVLWLDAHADFNTSALTPSGNARHAGGLPVRLRARGTDAAAGHARRRACAAQQIRQIGIRSVDGREALRARAGLEVFDMRYIDEVGMRQTMLQALAGLDEHTHLHVSFDVDFLDPDIAPAWAPPCPAAPPTARRSCAWR
jgi:arginase